MQGPTGSSRRISGLFHGIAYIVYLDRFPSFPLGHVSIKQPGIVTIVDLWHFVMVKPQNYTPVMWQNKPAWNLGFSQNTSLPILMLIGHSLNLLGNHRLGLVPSGPSSVWKRLSTTTYWKLRTFSDIGLDTFGGLYGNNSKLYVGDKTFETHWHSVNTVLSHMVSQPNFQDRKQKAKQKEEEEGKEWCMTESSSGHAPARWWCRFGEGNPR